MTAPSPLLDLDDVASLEAADSVGALRSAALGGAQVRATAAAVDEDALAALRGLRPRSVLLVTSAGRAARAASIIVAFLGGRAGLPVLHVDATPPWVGPLDVVIVAGDDAGDPRLLEAVDRAVRRGAEVVLTAPAEGPLRAAAAGRASILEPRVPVRDTNTLMRHVAAGFAVLQVVDATRTGPLLPDLATLADVLDAEAVRDNPRNEVFHNPAKSLAVRLHLHDVVLAGDTPQTTTLAAHGTEILLRCAGMSAVAADLVDVIAAAAKLGGAGTAASAGYDPFFHDEEIDGPRPRDKMRVFVLTTEPDRRLTERKVAVLPDADLIAVDPEGGEQLLRSADDFEPLAILAVRLEMAAAYLQLMTAGESV